MDPCNPAIFYSKPKGRSILNPANYPSEVEAYLEMERKIVCKLLPYFQGLIEFGCFQGTYAQICDFEKKAYIGLDISKDCIEKAKDQAEFFQIDPTRCEFFTLDINNLLQLKDTSPLYRKIPKEKWLLLLPFNLLGNIPLIDHTIDVIKRSGLYYFISTFKTTSLAIQTRREYYENCQLEGIKSRIVNNKGVLFTDSENFHSMAFMQHYLFYKLYQETHSIRMHDVGAVGNGTFYLPDFIEDDDIIHPKKNSI